MDASQSGVDPIRVIGVFAHIDAGKTTTSEVMLYLAGRTHRVGSVDDGNTQLDWMPQERERGITVTAAATTFPWRSHLIHLIDTPGHIDFSAEVVRSIRVIDGAVIVLCGAGGVETQSEAVWLHAERAGLPCILFVNKLDRAGADWGRVLAQAREVLSPRIVPLQAPIGHEGTFCGVVDLLSRQALTWQGGEAPVAGPVPAGMAQEVEEARAALIDAICETDDTLLELHLSGREPDEPALQAALRRATCRRRLIPVVCGSALQRIGVQPLLDAIAAYLPSPLERPPVRGVGEGGEERPCLPGAPLCAAAFKIVSDPYVGHLTWVRVFSGRLRAGETVLNPRTGDLERVGRLYRMHANRREQVEEITVGDVAALIGPHTAVTGDTLCDPAHPIALEPAEFPEPVILVAVDAPTEEERARLRAAVGRLCAEDPTLVARYDADTGEETLAGLGELHLEIAIDRLRTEFGIAPRVSPPEVAYRETVRRASVADGLYRKQTGGHGHYARVQLRIEPAAPGEGVLFVNEAPPSELTPQFVRAAEAGVREALEKGILAGYPVVDVRVTLLGGKYHEVDSSSMDFQIAGSLAVREAFRGASPALLEPVMAADISLREEYLGGVLADLSRRRASVRSVRAEGALSAIGAEAPLAEMRGYATDLRDLTSGRCTFMLRFLRHQLVPDAVAEAIVAQRRLAGRVPER